MVLMILKVAQFEAPHLSYAYTLCDMCIQFTVNIQCHRLYFHISVTTLKEISWIPDRFRVIFGKWNNSRKFKNMENICKHVEKYDFHGLKKQNL